MNLDIPYTNRLRGKILEGCVIDLSEISFCRPGGVILLCQVLARDVQNGKKKIILPTDTQVTSYMKRIHFDDVLDILGYQEAFQEMGKIVVPERDNPSIQEIVYCQFRDSFNARLDRFLKMFRNFGMNEEDSYRATSIVGELGNNVFDHNSGNWPTGISGCFLTAQSYPVEGSIEFAIGDVGVGFLGSLKRAFPELTEDIDAIHKGLAGYTGRIGEDRGNGLRLVQDWTINAFAGSLCIHSGKGMVTIDEKGTKNCEAFDVLGTLAKFIVFYQRPI